MFSSVKSRSVPVTESSYGSGSSRNPDGNDVRRGLPSNITFSSPDNGYEAFGDVTRGTPLDLLIHPNHFAAPSHENIKSVETTESSLLGGGKLPATASESMLSWSAMSDGSADTGKFSSASSSYFSDVDDFAFLCPSMMVMDNSVLNSTEAITIPTLTMDVLMMSEQEYDDKVKKAANMGRQATFSDDFLTQYNSVPPTAPLLPKTQFFLEKGKTFKVKARLHDIINAIEVTLKSASSIFTFDPKKIGWSVKCGSSQYTFTIRVFQVYPNDDSTHLIEFKRMSGCCIGFTRLYSSLHAALVKSGAIEPL